MADIEIIEAQGVSFVKLTLHDEMVRAERGALSYLRGDIKIKARVPPISDIIKRVLAEQTIVRPRYTGTGVIFLESSVGGFHLFELDETPWILEKGAYWASDGEVDLSVFRETVLTSLLSGEGFVALQTRVSGKGKVVLKSRGPVEIIDLDDDRVIADGRYVLARTEGIRHRLRRAAFSPLTSVLSGERWLRVYEGTGQVLLSSYPYWRYLLLAGEEMKQEI
jgi:uncharacterized protein (AIM24 family)